MRCGIDLMQSVLNAAAHLTAAGARKFDHVTHKLYIGLQVMRSCAPLPQGRSTTVSDRTGSSLSDVVSRRRLRSASTAEVLVPATHVVQPSVTAPSLSPVLEPGTVCLQICDSSGLLLFLNVT